MMMMMIIIALNEVSIIANHNIQQVNDKVHNDVTSNTERHNILPRVYKKI